MPKSKNNKKVRTFLGVYVGLTSEMKKFSKLPAKIRREREMAGVQAWHAWVVENKKSIVHMGAPLGATKQVDRKGITNISNPMGAFIIVKADSHAAAAKLFMNHPHFTIFPGRAVEVMECLEIPGM